MMLARLTPGRAGFGLQSFDCPKCNHELTIEVPEPDPLEAAKGWLSSELRPPVKMADYRAYTVGEDGHFINFRAFSCDNDPDAIVWAKQLVDGHPVELWSGARFILRLEQPEPGQGPAA